MPRSARGAARALIGALLLLVVFAASALADPNVIPIAGGGANSANDVLATTGSLAQPQQAAVLQDYDFYYREYVIADYDHCLVKQVGFTDATEASDVGLISTIVGSAGCGGGASASNTAGTSVQLDHPSSVSATPEHQVLIADSRNGRVDRWSPVALNGQSANTVTTLAGTKVDSGTCAIPADDSAAIDAKFCSLWRVAAHPWNFDTDSGGDKRFLVLDAGCGANDFPCGATAVTPRIYMVWFDTVSTSWKIKTAAVGCGGAGANAVCFTNPTGVTFTGADEGEFLVSDAGKNQIQRFSADDGSVHEVVAGTGQPTDDDGSNIGDDGPPTSATFSSPSDVTMTGDGGYYVADTFNCLIRKITDLTPQAVIFSIGGTCGDGLPATATLPSFDADLTPGGLAVGPAGLYVADIQTNQVKLFDRTTITVKPPRFTNSTRPTFRVEALEGYGPFACAWDDAPAEHVCQTSAGGGLEADNTPFQIPLDADPPFGEGEHNFRACISAGSTCSYDNDPNLPVDPTPAEWAFTVDTTAPQNLALVSPADGAGGLSPTPTFTWHTADGGPSGINHYELFVDDAHNADVPISACSGDSCSATTATALSEAGHTWKVRAVDGAGNPVDTAPRSFRSGSPPTASFTVAPNPVLAGRAVTFDGAASSDTSGPIAHYEWDLDGDGSFEPDGGTNPQATKTYTSPGSVTVQLRVTDGVGLTNVASAVVTVTAATIAGQLGVTVNNGAQYTNKRDVTLSVVGPPSLTQLLVSNDGGFLAPTPFAAAKQIAWKLDSSGPERLPKTVYVRFVQGLITSPNYTDDIILDERPPVVDQASVAPAAAAAATAAKLGTWKLKVKARDSNSGVAGIQVAAKKKKPSKLVPYKKKLKVKFATRPKYLRARDRAGNFSPWKKLR